MPSVLRLEAHEFTDLTRWRWVLTDAGGAFLADHEVHLDERDWQFEAAADLHGYISWHAAPDRHAVDEARIVHQVGAWLGDQVLGPDITQALVRKHPATVRVIIPPGAEALALLPLDISHADGKQLARHDVTLVTQTGTANPGPAGQRDRLRILGLFSLPEGGTPLNLRRERHELVKLINGIAANGRAAEIRVLQYGVTRARLRDILEAEGWHIIHISGHGRPGELLLETAAGRPDLITVSDLADLLDGAREHVQLVTLSACWSAALSTAEQRRLLGLSVPADQSRSAGQSGSPAPGTLATELAERLGCAVLAMRYPVDDEFAIGLSGKLYELLAAKGQPLPQAVAMTLKQLNQDGGTGGRRFPALSVAAPAIFGDHATQLRLLAPQRTGPVSYATGNLKMAGFPPQPDRFVGRTAVMARASEALASESGVPGVLLHGVPGGGKTACALELAYTNEHAFETLIWFKAPDEGAAIDGSLTDFALTLERYLDGFQVIHVLADDRKLTDFMPRFTELMERNRLLIIIDNAESLLTDSGQWRDDRWGQVAGALTGHSGLGRVVMTSRRVLAETLPVRVEAVDALTLDEGLLLARELPNLRKLIYGTLDGIGKNTARKLATDVLQVTQGHPKLLELADGQAANPDQLATLVSIGNQTWRDQGGLPDGFFSTGESGTDPDDYLQVLAAWTRAATDTLSPGVRDLFWFLCCLEEADRERPVLESTWLGLRRQLGRHGEPPVVDHAMAAIADRGLAAICDGGSKRESYAIHPGVAVAGAAHAGRDFQDAVDILASTFWQTVFQHVSGEAGNDNAHTQLIERTGLGAVPYLLRRQQWDMAAFMLERAFIQHPSRANAVAILPAIRRIVDHAPRHVGVLARVLQVVDPAAAENAMQSALDAAVAEDDYVAASASAGRLIEMHRNAGRLAEALALVDRKTNYTRHAQLGPWTRLQDQVQRMQILNETGRHEQVFAEVARLRGHMDSLPQPPGPDETVQPWNVRELLLGAARYAALLLGRWQDALDLSSEIIASQREHHVHAPEIARTRFGDHGPLLELGRTDEALDLLRDCQRIFQDANDIQGLGRTLTALARTEHSRGHGDAAIRMERDALRYAYHSGDTAAIAGSYHNLGNYLRVHTNKPEPAFSAHLAAALICAITGLGGAGPNSATEAIRSSALDVLQFGTEAAPPANVADLCRKLGNIPGTDPAALIARLSPDPETAERTLQDLIAQALALASHDAPSAGSGA